MPAPKGNKNAVRVGGPRTAGYRLTMTPENLAMLKKIACKEKSTIAQTIEKAILKAYPKEFTGKF